MEQAGDELMTEYTVVQHRYWMDELGEEDVLECVRGGLARAQANGLEHWCLFLEGRLALAERRFEEAMRFFDELLDALGNLGEPIAATLRAWSLYDKAIIFYHDGQFDKCIRVIDELVARCSDSDLPELQRWRPKAVLFKADIHRRQGQSDKALSAYKNALCLYSGHVSELSPSEARDLAKMVDMSLEADEQHLALTGLDTLLEFANERACDGTTIWALGAKGVLLSQLGRAEEAMHFYDELIQRIEDVDLPDKEVWKAIVLLNKGRNYLVLEEFHQAIDVYDSLVRQYAGKGKELQEWVCEALLRKADILTKQGRFEQAVRVCVEILRRFKYAEEPSLKRKLVTAGRVRLRASREYCGQARTRLGAVVRYIRCNLLVMSSLMLNK